MGKLISYIILLLLVATSCSTVLYRPVPDRLNDSAYSKPQPLSAKSNTPSEATSTLDKQVKFVTLESDNSLSRASSKKRGEPKTEQASAIVDPINDKSRSVSIVTKLEQKPEIAKEVVVEDPEYIEIDDLADPSSRQAAIVSPSRDNQHPSRTSYNPFDSKGRLMVDLDQESSKFCYPINGKYSSGYGSRGRGWHSGVDLTAPAGTSIYAAFDGRVRMSKPYGGYGNVIVLTHANGLETLYGHNAKNLVVEGEQVKAGQKIALCGRTGRATGNHLHFEVRIAGSTINPSLLIDYSQKSIQSGTLVVAKNGSRISASRSSGEIQVDNTEKPLPPKKEDVILAKEATSPSPAKVSSVNNGGQSYHTIIKGDTLFSLAKRYGTTVDKLCSINNISKTIILKLGVKLRMN